MLLQRLVESYEVMLEDEGCEVPTYGYCMANVHYAAVISKEGELKSLVSLKVLNDAGKKYVPVSMVVPQQAKKTSGISSNFLCENATYVFGVDFKDKPSKAKQSFEAFRERHLEILEGLDNAECQAFVAFIENWDYENPLNHRVIEENYDDLSGANIIFQYEGNKLAFLHENDQVKRVWEEKNNDAQGDVMQCLVTGETSPVSRLHPLVKGLMYGQSMGNTLVGFNAVAYESYGRHKDQGLNSPVSEYAAFAYGTALNHMLADRDHRLVIGDTTTVFWAASKDQGIKDCMAMIFNPDELAKIDEASGGAIRDTRAVREMKSIFYKLSQGQPIEGVQHVFDDTTKVFILGLSPNAARISVRFMVEDSFGDFLTKSLGHYKDMRIEKQYDSEPDAISLWRMLNETIPPASGAKAKMASPVLAGSVMRAVVQGLQYPDTLYKAILLRIKAEKKINYVKASIIKGYLTRKLAPDKKERAVLTMSLNQQSDAKPYVLGRLFAVLEKAQEDANPGAKLNTTIKDRYFTSASATPGIIFPRLLALSNHHIKKSEYGSTTERRIQAIMDKLYVEDKPFPTRLTTEEQGIFILGYYHQRNAFYRKSEEAEQ